MQPATPTSPLTSTPSSATCEPAAISPKTDAAQRPALGARPLAGLRGAWWAHRAVTGIRADVRAAGLEVPVCPPPTTARGSLRGARIALRVRRASCLERSLVVQRWWASRGVALEVIVGVRHPSAAEQGPLAHAWVDRWDDDWSPKFAEIRRIPAPGGVPPAAPR